MTKNIFKRALSIVLCVAMLVTTMSFVLTASALEYETLVDGIVAEDYTETDTHDTNSSVKDTTIADGKITAPNGENYAYFVSNNAYNLNDGALINVSMGETNTGDVGHCGYTYIRIGDSLLIGAYRGYYIKGWSATQAERDDYAANGLTYPSTTFIVDRTQDTGNVVCYGRGEANNIKGKVLASKTYTDVNGENVLNPKSDYVITITKDGANKYLTVTRDGDTICENLDISSYDLSAANIRFYTKNWWRSAEVSDYTLKVPILKYDVDAAVYTSGVESTAGGTVSADVNLPANVRSGSTVTLMAAAKSGYVFDGWYENEVAGTPVSKDLTYTATVTDNVTYIANFVEHVIEDTLFTGSFADGFTVSGNNKDATNATLQMDGNYWQGPTATSDNTVNLGKNWKNTFTMNLSQYNQKGKKMVFNYGNLALTYTFATDTTYNVVATWGGTAIEATASTYSFPAANEAYEIEFDDGALVLSVNDVVIYSFTKEQFEAVAGADWSFADSTVIVNWNKMNYNVSRISNYVLTAYYYPGTVNATVYTEGVAGTAGGTVNGNPELPAFVSYGGTVTLTAAAKSGYSFDGWYVGSVSGDPVSTDLTYVATVTGDVTYIANFVESKQTVTVLQDIADSTKWTYTGISSGTITDVNKYVIGSGEYTYTIASKNKVSLCNKFSATMGVGLKGNGYKYNPKFKYNIGALTLEYAYSKTTADGDTLVATLAYNGNTIKTYNTTAAGTAWDVNKVLAIDFDNGAIVVYHGNDVIMNVTADEFEAVAGTNWSFNDIDFSISGYVKWVTDGWFKDLSVSATIKAVDVIDAIDAVGDLIDGGDYAAAKDALAAATALYNSYTDKTAIGNGDKLATYAAQIQAAEDQLKADVVIDAIDAVGALIDSGDYAAAKTALATAVELYNNYDGSAAITNAAKLVEYNKLLGNLEQVNMSGFVTDDWTLTQYTKAAGRAEFTSTQLLIPNTKSYDGGDSFNQSGSATIIHKDKFNVAGDAFTMSANITLLAAWKDGTHHEAFISFGSLSIKMASVKKAEAPAYIIIMNNGQEVARYSFADHGFSNGVYTITYADGKISIANSTAALAFDLAATVDVEALTEVPVELDLTDAQLAMQLNSISGGTNGSPTIKNFTLNFWNNAEAADPNRTVVFNNVTDFSQNFNVTVGGAAVHVNADSTNATLRDTSGDWGYIKATSQNKYVFGNRFTVTTTYNREGGGTCGNLGISASDDFVQIKAGAMSAYLINTNSGVYTAIYYKGEQVAISENPVDNLYRNVYSTYGFTLDYADGVAKVYVCGMLTLTAEIEDYVAYEGNLVIINNMRYIKNRVAGVSFVNSPVATNFGLEISGSGSVTLGGVASHNAYVKPGLTVALNATANDGYVFQAWVNKANDTIVSTDASFSVIANAVNTFEAVFVPADAEGITYIVTVLNKFDKVIYTTSVADGGAYVLPEGPALKGYEFGGWLMNGTGDALAAGDSVEVNGNIIFTPVYNGVANETVYTITVDGNEYTTAKYNTLVTVTTDVANFAYWTKQGVIVSYNRTYSFYAGLADDSTTIALTIAVSDDEVSATPITNIINQFAQTNKVTFQMERSVPANYSLVASGFILAKAEFAGSDYLSQVNGTTVKKIVASDTSANGQYMLNVNTNAPGVTVYAVSYVTYVDANGNIATVYSTAAVATSL